ncbi:26S proteasome non-ATPase regulatory subunit 9 isoform X5 [Amborella trichopoda]|uniref:26S proteasome non-ATPase regulatory subunit 9 isoform X5 n=1 Tax=Amborella trichopoda TaxID=13333 RepID=UPI0005D38697|nr:26S proteasome non-ATPase regulatory subunit 9 isoform X5 [Amborella trichopoda]|eukprot:XP_011628051.1 26S proteasome non-ATPase regulatory subunit 9 isoform X5 [Amborella trichopoda]
MVGTNLKAETTALMEKRSLLEEQMSAIISRLCVPGGPGLSGNLLDSEGFPRADIDIAAVRLERNNLAVLRNDHKDITAKIDQNLQLLHSTRLAQDISLPPKVSGTSQENFYTAMDEDPVVGVPFAIVDEIADGSPASDDGLQLGDQIVKFSNVEGGEQLLARLASEAQSNQGCALPLVIVRQGMFINLAVTPRPWHGRGLLGCHFRIL